MQVALAHDYFYALGGAEQTVAGYARPLAGGARLYLFR